MRAIIVKLFRFCIIGFVGLIIDFSVTWFCKEKLKWHKYAANTLGFSLACISNYLLDRWWTFQSTSQHVAKEFSLFALFSAIGLGINTLLIYLLHNKFRFNFYVSKAIATFVVVLWNFSANNFLTFRNAHG